MQTSLALPANYQKRADSLGDEPAVFGGHFDVSHLQPVVAADYPGGSSKAAGVCALEEIHLQLHRGCALPRRQGGADGAEEGGVHQRGNQPAVDLPSGLQVVRLHRQRDAADTVLGQTFLDADESQERRIIVAGQNRPSTITGSALRCAGKGGGCRI